MSWGFSGPDGTFYHEGAIDPHSGLLTPSLEGLHSVTDPNNADPAR
jgi:hypothetical protein